MIWMNGLAAHHAHEAVAQLEAEALVVGAPVVEGIAEHRPCRLGHRRRPRDACAFRSLAARSRHHLPQDEKAREEDQAVDGGAEPLLAGGRHHDVRLMGKPARYSAGFEGSKVFCLPRRKVWVTAFFSGAL